MVEDEEHSIGKKKKKKNTIWNGQSGSPWSEISVLLFLYALELSSDNQS